MELTFLAVDSTLLRTHSNVVYIQKIYTYTSMCLSGRTHFFFINNIPDCVISNQAFLLLDQAFLLHFGVTARITRSNPVGGIDVCFA